MEGLLADGFAADDRLLLPDPRSHLCEDIVELALGLAVGPPVAIGAEAEAVAPRPARNLIE